MAESSPRRVGNKAIFHPFLITLPTTNIAPENGWLEDYFPLGKAYF